MLPERPEEPGRRKALAFTLAVHLALIGALFFGVQWKRSEPEAMQVELWSPVPVKATRVETPPPPKPVVEPVPPRPAPPPPPPKIETPKKPDIVVKEEKKKPEPKKPEPPKPEPPKPEPKKPEPAKPEPKPAVDPFKEMLERETRQRQVSAEQNRLAALADKEQRAAAARRGMESYAMKIRVAIRNKIVLPPAINGNPEAVFEVNQLPGGDVLSVHLKRSSGMPALDAAIERAIRSASPLPSPADPSDFRRVLEIKYKPFEE